jgi:predicted homoserine dehydrogenase-like protein
MNPSGPCATPLYASMDVCSTQAQSGELSASTWYDTQPRERLDLCSESAIVRYFLPRSILYENRDIVIGVSRNARIIPGTKMDDLITREDTLMNLIFCFDIR